MNRCVVFHPESPVLLLCVPVRQRVIHHCSLVLQGLELLRERELLEIFLFSEPFNSNFLSIQAQDIETLKKFLLNKKPHVVTVAGENR